MIRKAGMPEHGKVFMLSLTMVADLLRQGDTIGPFKVVNGLPQGTRICSMEHDAETDRQIVLAEHDDFAGTAVGEEYPEGDISAVVLRWDPLQLRHVE